MNGFHSETGIDKREPSVAPSPFNEEICAETRPVSSGPTAAEKMTTSRWVRFNIVGSKGSLCDLIAVLRELIELNRYAV